tara:strand:+ start:328 stop:1569 length:1242 start_codon:yes stop_codon:yes gene_type:complete
MDSYSDLGAFVEIRDQNSIEASPLLEHQRMNYREKKTFPKTFAEFFAGIGLMRIGLERAGWKISVANDIDESKEKMYQEHFADAEDHFLLDDVHELSATQIPPSGLATASFPCNDLSLAGGRTGLKGKNSSAFFGFTNLLRKLGTNRPPIILLENVAGFLSSNGGRDFEDAMLELNDLGYTVDPLIIDAAAFVPQSRVRLFVIGVRSRNTQPHVLNDSFFESSVRPSSLADYVFTHPDINWNIRRLPDLPQLQSSLKDVLEDLPANSSHWWDSARADYLFNQMSERHRQVAESMMSRRRWSYGTVFRRVRNGKSMAELRTDGIAGCLRTPRGGSGRQILFKAGFGRYQVRLLTPRECARLMGADDYQISVPLNQALFGFGDAVCVPAVEWIARNYLNPIWKEQFSSQSIANQS